MKPYTQQEQDLAKKKLRQPVLDFLRSEDLLKIYAGIRRKHALSLNQMTVVSSITNTTILGLEPESAFETNLHQMLPELSSATTREVVEDVNDRIFKESRRRLQENITAPTPVWDADELGTPEDQLSGAPSDADLDAIYEKERLEEEARILGTVQAVLELAKADRGDKPGETMQRIIDAMESKRSTVQAAKTPQVTR